MDTEQVDESRPVVGQTGARFSGPTGRQRTQPNASAGYPLSAIPVTEPDRTDAMYDSAHAEKIDWVVDKDDWIVEESDWDGPEQAFELVRPYSWTKGRTTCHHDLAIEALVSATRPGPYPEASPEHQAVLGLCQAPRSVAELAALLSVPLGVIRVVLGDMAATGAVVVHRTAGTADGAPDIALMQRVLTCLQRL